MRSSLSETWYHLLSGTMCDFMGLNWDPAGVCHRQKSADVLLVILNTHHPLHSFCPTAIRCFNTPAYFHIWHTGTLKFNSSMFVQWSASHLRNAVGRHKHNSSVSYYKDLNIGNHFNWATCLFNRNKQTQMLTNRKYSFGSLCWLKAKMTPRPPPTRLREMELEVLWKLFRIVFWNMCVPTNQVRHCSSSSKPMGGAVALTQKHTTTVRLPSHLHALLQNKLGVGFSSRTTKRDVLDQNETDGNSVCSRH